MPLPEAKYVIFEHGSMALLPLSHSLSAMILGVSQRQHWKLLLKKDHFRWVPVPNFETHLKISSQSGTRVVKTF